MRTPRRQRHASTFLGRDHGQAAVELGVFMPFLCLLLVGIFTCGVAMRNFVTLQEAVGAGGRQLAISRGQGGDPCAIAAAAVAADAPALNNNGSSSTGLGFTITVGGQTFTSATPSCPNATFTQGQPVVITGTYPCTLRLFNAGSHIPVLSSNPMSNCYLTVQTTEVIQ